MKSPEPTLKDRLDDIPWDGNEKVVPHALLTGTDADQLEAIGYVVGRSGLGGVVLNPSPVRR